MSIIAIEAPEVMGGDVIPLDEDDHVHCCTDPTAGLCGVLLSGDTGKELWEQAGCVVCDDLADTKFCPKGFTCPPRSGMMRP